METVKGNSNRKVRILKVCNGNPTSLIYSRPIKLDKKTIFKLLKESEQIGFVFEYNKIPKLNMIGNELSINSTLAFASQLSKKGILLVSGIKEPVEYINKNNGTTIKFPLNYKKEDNIVLLGGIGFICFDKKIKNSVSKTFLSNFAKKYRLPSFGVIIYNKNKIEPYVYVKKINSFFKESACGSASIALSILKGYNKIIQPTGKPIYINIDNKMVEVSGKVTKIDKELNITIKDRKLR